jgi:hypothetical protein
MNGTISSVEEGENPGDGDCRWIPVGSRIHQIPALEVCPGHVGDEPLVAALLLTDQGALPRTSDGIGL